MEGRSRNSRADVTAADVAEHLKLRGQHTNNHNFESHIREEYQKLFNPSQTESELSRQVNLSEVDSAIRMVKTGRAAGDDGIYPEMIKHLGTKSRKWLARVF